MVRHGWQAPMVGTRRKSEGKEMPDVGAAVREGNWQQMDSKSDVQQQQPQANPSSAPPQAPAGLGPASTAASTSKEQHHSNIDLSNFNFGAFQVPSFSAFSSVSHSISFPDDVCSRPIFLLKCLKIIMVMEEWTERSSREHNSKARPVRGPVRGLVRDLELNGELQGISTTIWSVRFKSSNYQLCWHYQRREMMSRWGGMVSILFKLEN